MPTLAIGAAATETAQVRWRHRALRRSIDPVFLPRRLRLVDALPRNETGKLPRAALLRMLDAGGR